MPSIHLDGIDPLGQLSEHCDSERAASHDESDLGTTTIAKSAGSLPFSRRRAARSQRHSQTSETGALHTAQIVVW